LNSMCLRSEWTEEPNSGVWAWS